MPQRHYKAVIEIDVYAANDVQAARTAVHYVQASAGLCVHVKPEGSDEPWQMVDLEPDKPEITPEAPTILQP